MKMEEYRKMMTKSFKKRLKIHAKKSHDYATEDVLANFKRVANIMKVWKPDISTPHGVAFVYIVLKLDRFANLVFRNKKPLNESVQDTIDDLKNYMDLMEACYNENI